MYIRHARGFSENMSYNPLYISQRYENAVFVMAHGDYIAILNPPSDFGRNRQLTMEVSSSVPLWKQHMDLTMGKTPKSHIVSSCCVYFELIPTEVVSRYSYKVYECVM